MDEVVVFVNPRSGGGWASRVFAALHAREPRLAAARVVHVADPGSARAQLADAVGGGTARVLAFGGDGTIQLVANVLLEQGLGGRIGLGIVPAGTGSDLARTLGIPRRAPAALAHALTAPLRPMDILRLDADDGRRRYVLNVASAGISGLVDEAVNALERRTVWTYLVATLGALGRYRHATCRLTVDGALWRDGPILLVAIANGRAFGNGMRVAPHAEPDDGLADVILVTPVPGWQLPFRLPQIYLGTHLRAPFVRCGQARVVRIEPVGPFPPIDVDGETLEPGSCTISVVPGALLVAATAAGEREGGRAGD
jgi:diacylglycerol kinase (ATP)